MSDSGRFYRSPIPYETTRINAAAVYCSDGRIGDHMDEFLHQGLALPRYDRVACPGGPVALAGRLLAFWESRGVLEQLRFLVQVHEVRQVVLIAHGGCAYYHERLGMQPATAESEQREDLARAASAVQRIDTTLEVAGFFAHVEGTTVSYERVFASEAIDLRLKHVPAPGPTAPLEMLVPGRPEPANPPKPGAAVARDGAGDARWVRPGPAPRSAPRR
jgi:hypothetical protein